MVKALRAVKAVKAVKTVKVVRAVKAVKAVVTVRSAVPARLADEDAARAGGAGCPIRLTSYLFDQSFL